jgi:hypothetical protein
MREKILKHTNIDDSKKPSTSTNVDMKLFLKKEQLDIYKQFHRMFHVIKQSKILLMSGTVMKSGKITNQHGF